MLQVGAYLCFAISVAEAQSLTNRSIIPVLELGAINGVPGFSDSKWGQLAGIQLELGKSERLKFSLEGDYVLVASAATCCGPPGGFTYDDHGILGTVGFNYSLGPGNLALALSSAIGVTSYRQTRKGSVPGFTPAPTHGWQFGGIANAGIELRAISHQGLLFSAGVRDYVGLTAARVGTLKQQPALLLGVGWAGR